MRYTQIRPARVVLLAAAYLLLPGVGSAKAPPKTPSQSPMGLEAKLTGRSLEEQQAILNQLAREWTARLGAVEVAHQRLIAQAEELRKAQLRLGSLKEPEAKTVPLMFRSADVDAVTKVAQQRADYFTERTQHLETIVASATTLSKLDAEFDLAVNAAQTQHAQITMALQTVPKYPNDKLPEALKTNRFDESAARLKTLTTGVNATRDKTKADLNGLEASLKETKAAVTQATAKLDELKRDHDSLLAAFAFEERVRGMTAQQLSDEFNRLHKLLAEKLAAIQGDETDYTKSTAAVTEARTKLHSIQEPAIPPEEASAASLPPLEQAARHLFVAQQQYSARVRTMDERDEKTKALISALDEQEKKAIAYLTTLEDSRRMTEQLNTVASEIEERVGRKDLEPAKVPDGVADAISAIREQTKFVTNATKLQAAIAQLKEEREILRKPNSETDSIKTLTHTLLKEVSERIDRLTDLKKLATEYATTRNERAESEQKRIDQLATERMAKDAGRADWFFALDRSPSSTRIAALLDAYYKELIELDEKQANLKRQNETLKKLAEQTQKESADITKLQTVLEKRGAQSKDVRQWENWLASRLTPTGLKAEATIYHDEIARINAIGGSNSRRIATLTGNTTPEVKADTSDELTHLAVNGGEIGKARAELFAARVRGWTITGIEIGLVLLAALILPRLVTFILRRAIRGGTDGAGNPTPVLAALRGALRIGVWIAALAIILSIFGFDVTALIVALAIGVLAVALAARPMIADVLGSVVIFAERRFKVGDVVRFAGSDPARVVDITWRSTALKNTNGLVLSVPNRKVTETTVENLSRGAETYDSLAVTISTDKDAGKVIGVIRGAMAQCKNLSPDHGITVLSYNHKGMVKIVQYRFWWFLKDYEARNKTRDEVFARIALGLAHEDMTGIEVTLG